MKPILVHERWEFLLSLKQFKAALIKVFILVMDNMTDYVKEVAHRDKCTEMYHPTQF